MAWYTAKILEVACGFRNFCGKLGLPSTRRWRTMNLARSIISFVQVGIFLEWILDLEPYERPSLGIESTRDNAERTWGTHNNPRLVWLPDKPKEFQKSVRVRRQRKKSQTIVSTIGDNEKPQRELSWTYQICSGFPRFLNAILGMSQNYSQVGFPNWPTDGWPHSWTLNLEEKATNCWHKRWIFGGIKRVV